MGHVTKKNSRLKTACVVFLAAMFLLVLNVATAYAESDLEIEVSLDKSEMQVGERARLTVTVSGPSGFSEPAIPATDGLEVILQGRTQSVQIVNMKVKSSKIFIYAVVPYKTGEFTIGPIQVTRGGQTYEGSSVDLSVQENVQPQKKFETPDNVIVEAGVDNVNPYVGQQIILMFRFAQRASARIRNVGYQLPDLENFWKEEIKSKREYTKSINGLEYLVTEIAIPLFPVKEGDMTVDGITFHYDEEISSQRRRRDSPFSKNPLAPGFFDDDFFSMFDAFRAERRVVRTAPININVRALPRKDRPKGFKGGVGDFKLTADLSNDEVKVGESVTLTLSVSGAGNIRDILDPKLDIEGVKIYSDTPAVDVKGDNDVVVGEKVYKLALVPQQAGPIQIPQISIPYFNPQTDRYELASSAPMTLKALPSEEEALVVAQAPLAREKRDRTPPAARDVLPIHERLDSIEIGGFELWLRRLRPIAYPLPLILYAVCFAFIRHKERLRTDVAYRRERMANKMAQAHIEDAVKAMKQQQWQEVFAKCSRAVTEYLANRLNVPAGGLTSADVESALSSQGVPKDFVAEIVGFLEGCDYGRFASPQENAGVVMKYIQKARHIIKRLEHEGVVK